VATSRSRNAGIAAVLGLAYLMMALLAPRQLGMGDVRLAWPCLAGGADKLPATAVTGPTGESCQRARAAAMPSQDDPPATATTNSGNLRPEWQVTCRPSANAPRTALVAQGIEQWFPKPRVGCSNHPGGTLNTFLRAGPLSKVEPRHLPEPG
jgi:hypothetical protein